MIADGYSFEYGQLDCVKGQSFFFKEIMFLNLLAMSSPPKSNWTHLYVYPRRYTGLFFPKHYKDYERDRGRSWIYTETQEEKKRSRQISRQVQR